MKSNEATQRLLRVLLQIRKAGKLDVTQKAIGQITGLTQSSISQIFNGHRDFPLTKLPDICKAYNINPSYIISGEMPVYGKPKIKSMDIDELFSLVQKCFSEIENLKRELREMKKAARK